MIRIDAAHLPPGTATGETRVLAEHDDVLVTAPALDPAAVRHVCTALLAARERLAAMPADRIIHAIDSAARALLEPGEPERAAVLASLRAVSGFSAAMAEHLLDRAAQDWTAAALGQLISDELGDAAAIESFVEVAPGRRVRAVAAPLGLHVLSGNVPGVGVTSVARALLVRSAVLAKSAAAEPVLTAAFARLLARADPEVGAAVAVTWWPGGDAALEAAALDHVGIVVHYGGRDAIDSLRARAPAHVKFIEHGPRVSFAIVHAGAVDEATAADLARAVALFDQQGCVSPQLAYVIGGAAEARALAAATASELDRLARTLPRGRITPADAAAIRAARSRAEFRAIAGHDSEAWGPERLDFSVILSDDPAFEGSCLNRTLIIKHVPDLHTLLRHIAPAAPLLQTVGVAGFHDPALSALATALVDVGASRITSIAAMPWPPPSWHHDGRGPLRELIRWVDLETPLG